MVEPTPKQREDDDIDEGLPPLDDGVEAHPEDAHDFDLSDSLLPQLGEADDASEDGNGTWEADAFGLEMPGETSDAEGDDEPVSDEDELALDTLVGFELPHGDEDEETDDADEDLDWLDDEEGDPDLGSTWVELADLDLDADSDLGGDEPFDEEPELGLLDDTLPLPDVDLPALRLAGTLPGRWSPSRMQLQTTGEEPVYVLGSGGIGLVAGDRLLRFSGERLAPISATGLAADVTSIVEWDGTIFVGTGWSGVQRSPDGGKSFADLATFPRHPRAPSTHVLCTPSSLWVRDGAGRLFRSEDRGQRFSAPLEPAPLRAWALDGDRLAALCSSPRGPLLATTTEGTAWDVRSVQGVDTSGDDVPALALSGEMLAIALPQDQRGLLLSMDGGASFERCPNLTGCHAMALSPSRVGVLYAVVRLAPRYGVLIRYDQGAEATIVDFSERLPGDRGGETPRTVFALELERGHTGETRLRLATSCGVVIVDIEELEA